MSLITRLIASLCLFFIPSTAYSSDEAHWSVEAIKLKCLLENIATYKSATTDPVIIYLDACPEADTVAVISKSSRNSSIPQVPRRNHQVGRPHTVIVYTKTELDCLVTKITNIVGEIVQIPRRPCAAI